MIDRKEIKAKAKEKINGNKWNLIWPLLAISIGLSVIQSIIAKIGGVDTTADIMATLQGLEVETTTPLWYTIVSDILTLAEGVFTFAYTKYLLNIVRNGKAEFNDIIDYLKTDWKRILLVTILFGLFIGLGVVALIIPGIIVALGLSMCEFLLVDTKDKPMDIIKNSWNMMKNHKWEYFVFILSFFGWFLLTIITFGIALIWLIPFMNVANAMYYDKLKEITQK